jgi:hypothetical protein
VGSPGELFELGPITPSEQALSPEAYVSKVVDELGHAVLSSIIEEGLQEFGDTGHLPQCQPAGQQDAERRYYHIRTAAQIQAHNRRVIETRIGETIPVGGALPWRR